MKKFLIIILFFALVTPVNAAGVLNPKMGVQAPFTSFGSTVSLSATTFAVDGSWNFGVAGSKALLYRFTSPVQQVSGNLTCYVYATAKTGSPTGQEMVLYTGPNFGADDAQRPNSTAVATSTNVDVSALTLPGWIEYDFTGVTLATSTYFAAITNTTATPASNFVTYFVRPQNFLNGFRVSVYSTTDGLTTDPVLQSSSTEPPIVCKFNDGTLMGNPYVSTVTLTSNTNYRGMRFQYDANVEVAGFIQAFSTTLVGTWYLYQGANLIETIIPDRYQLNNNSAIFFSSPRTFTGGVPYDIVWKPISSTSIGTGASTGVSPPADVSAATFSQMGTLNGATPGSFTYTQGDFTGIVLLPNNIPAASGSSLTDILGNVLQ